MTPLPEQTPEVRDQLARIRKQSEAVLQASLDMMKADKGALFPVDLLAIGAVKRHVSTAAAFCLLIEAWNIVCARALLRLQIDTALRFSAAWLVDKPHEFASSVLAGEQINRLKDAGGLTMTDHRLVELRSQELPWLPAVYTRLSGYVHLSSSHIFMSMQRPEDHEVAITIRPADTEMPPQSWLEVTGCFLEVSDFFLGYLHGWVDTKNQRPGASASP